MMREKSRRPSPLQRRGADCAGRPRCERPGRWRRGISKRVLEQGGDAPVYGPNLRASCRRMEAAGWLRTLRAPKLQLAVELTQDGRGIAEPLFQAEREAETARQRLTDVRVCRYARRLPVTRWSCSWVTVITPCGSGLRDPSGRYHLPAADDAGGIRG